MTPHRTERRTAHQPLPEKRAAFPLMPAAAAPSCTPVGDAVAAIIIGTSWFWGPWLHLIATGNPLAFGG